MEVRERQSYSAFGIQTQSTAGKRQREGAAAWGRGPLLARARGGGGGGGVSPQAVGGGCEARPILKREGRGAGPTSRHIRSGQGWFEE